MPDPATLVKMTANKGDNEGKYDLIIKYYKNSEPYDVITSVLPTVLPEEVLAQLAVWVVNNDLDIPGL